MKSFRLHLTPNVRWVLWALSLHAAAVFACTLAAAAIYVSVTGPWSTAAVLASAIVDAVPAGVPGSILLLSFHRPRRPAEVLTFVAAGFAVRLAVVAYLGFAVVKGGPGAYGLAVVSLAGLLAGFSAEGLLIARPPPRRE